MLLALTIIGQILPFLSQAIGNKWVDLGEVIEKAIETLWTAYKAGNVTNEVLVSVQQLQAILQAVQNDTNADPAKLAMAEELAGIVAASITGLQAAEAGADPADLPIPPEVV